MSAEVPEPIIEHGPDAVHAYVPHAVRAATLVGVLLSVLWGGASLFCAGLIVLLDWPGRGPPVAPLLGGALFFAGVLAVASWLFRQVRIARTVVSSRAGITWQVGARARGAPLTAVVLTSGVGWRVVTRRGAGVVVRAGWLSSAKELERMLRRVGASAPRAPRLAPRRARALDMPIGPEPVDGPIGYRDDAGPVRYSLLSPRGVLGLWAHGGQAWTLYVMTGLASVITVEALVFVAPDEWSRLLNTPNPFTLVIGAWMLSLLLPLPTLERWQRYRRFLGPGLVRVAHGVWASPEGRRRARCTPGDRARVWDRSAHLHLEELSLDGVTLSSHVAWMPALSADVRVLGSWHAVVEPRRWEPRIFTGPPHAPQSAFAEPRHLLRQDTGDGWLLIRFDDSLQYAGDTWHTTKDELERQVRQEMGVTPAWRELDEAPTDYTFVVDQK